MKCILCEQKKAKRYCPAKHDKICATCCGTKRVVEINCPKDCPYLGMGLEYQAHASFDKQNRKMDPFKQIKYERTLERFEGFIVELKYPLAEQYKLLKGLNDEDILEAVSLLIRSYETEEKGIIYPYQSHKPYVQAVVKALQKVIEEHRKPLVGHEGHTRLLLRDIIDCLSAIKDELEFHMAENTSPTGYLDFITQFFPEVNKQEQSRIIIP